MFDKLRKMVEERMNPRPQLPMTEPMLPKAVARQPLQRMAAPEFQRPQPKQAIPQGYSSMNPQQVSAYNTVQPYTQDNVRTNSLVDAGELPESRREGSLRVMANRGLQTDQEDPQNRIFWI
jgi:hypothetical protein